MRWAKLHVRILVATTYVVVIIPAPANASFPGRNGPIVFAEGSDTPVDFDLFTVSANGSGLRQLTSGPEADTDAEWAPDGRRIVFARSLPVYAQSDIYVLETVTNELTNVTAESGGYDTAPSWSPDGERIVFVRHFPPTEALSNTADLYTVDVDGTSAEQLTNFDGDELQPQWSPRGDVIAYTDRETIWLIDPGTGKRVNILAASGRVAQASEDLGIIEQLSWSPDGRRIAFSDGDGDGPPSGDIWVVNRDGSGLRNLTAKSSAGDDYPSWSPDGKWIAFLSGLNSDGGSSLESTRPLHRMRADGTEVTKIVDISSYAAFSTDWGPRP